MQKIEALAHSVTELALRYPIFTIFQENLYKTEILLVEHAGPILYESFSHWMSSYRASLSSYQKCSSQFENFAIGNFLVGWVGQWKNGWIVTKRYSRMRMRERDLHTKFQLDRPEIAEVIPFFHF